MERYNMNLEELKQHEWIINYSGGKDSVATVICCIYHKIPIKEIVHVKLMYDKVTPVNLPISINFIENSLKLFENKYGIKTSILKPKYTALDLLNKTYKHSKYKEKNNKRYSLTNFQHTFCNLSSIKHLTVKKLL